MEDKEPIDLDYQKGFNDGYLIAKYEPELAEKLSKINAVSSRIVGMQQGREQLILEQVREKLPSWLKGEREIEMDNDHDKDLDIELER